MPDISEERLKELEEAAEAAKQLAATKKRLEDENSKIKSRAQEAEGKLSEAEKRQLEAEGKTQELLEKERSEKQELLGKLNKTSENVLREKLRTAVLKHATDAHDVDMVLKVSDHQDLLKLDKEALTVDGVKDYVGKVRESHSYLFSKKSMDPGDNTPPGSGTKEEFKTENEKYAEALKGATTKQELAKIRKQFGKPID